jgi:hypothetical protein
LYYKNIPAANFAAADAVIGQDNFEEKEYEPEHAIWPYSVKISDSGAMIIADTQYYRCLYWKDHETAFTRKADYIIGQPDRQSNGQNQYRLQPTAHTLNWCYDACFIHNHVLVADTGNSRLLFFDIPAASNPSAISIIGQLHFEMNGEASLSMKSTLDHQFNLYWPFSVSAWQDMLAVADTGKSRILLYQINPSL